MTREAWLWLLLAIALGSGLTWLFFENFELTEDTVSFGYSPAARLDDNLAATRFLNRMGLPAEAMATLTPQSPLSTGEPGGGPGGGQVLMLTTKRLTLGRDTQRVLLDWVRAGGYLIISARTETEFDGLGDLFEQINESIPESDSLFEALDLELVELDLDDDEVDEYGSFGVDFAAAEDFVWVRFDPRYRLLTNAARWQPLAGDEHGAVAVSGAVGAGHVSVFADRKVLHNRRIGEQDHALFLWRLVNLYGVPAMVRVISEDDMPTLPRWLWTHAREWIISLLLIAVLALMTLPRRFGPLRDLDPPVRRSVVEHIRAGGGFLWRYGYHDGLLRGLRDDVRREMLEKHPATDGLDPARTAAHLAAIVDLSEGDIRRALTPPAVLGVTNFTHSVRLLTALRKQL